MVDQAPTPTELRLSKDKRQLTVAFANSHRFELSAELLRVESPSAEVQGHDPSQKKIIPGKRNVEIMMKKVFRATNGISSVDVRLL